MARRELVGLDVARPLLGDLAGAAIGALRARETGERLLEVRGLVLRRDEIAVVGVSLGSRQQLRGRVERGLGLLDQLVATLREGRELLDRLFDLRVVLAAPEIDAGLRNVTREMFWGVDGCGGEVLFSCP